MPKNMHGVPKCTQHYAEMQVDPFGPSVAHDVCLPSTLLPLPSWKLKTRATVSWQTGTGGAGFLLVAPGRTWSSGVDSIWATTSTYDGTASYYPAKFGTGIFPHQVVSSIRDTDSSATRVRLVGWGSKTSVSTPGLTRGGRLVGYQNVSRSSITGGAGNQVTLGGCQTLNPASAISFGTERTDFRYVGSPPTQPEHLEFLGSGSAALENACYLIACETPSSSQQTLYTELIFYWEILMVDGGSSETSSHSDPQFAGCVVSAASNAIRSNPEHSPHDATWRASVMRHVSAGWDLFRPVVRDLDASKVQRAVELALGGAQALRAFREGGTRRIVQRGG